MAAAREIKYSYNNCPTIYKFAESNAFVRGLLGPVGGGKSSGCVIEVVRRAMMQKPGSDGIARTRWAVIRNSFPMLRETTIKTFFQWFPPESFGRWYATDHRYVIKSIPKCEIEILFQALDRPDDIKKLLSLDLTGAWVNEAREIPWSIIETLQGRCGRYPPASEGGPTWYGLWMDTNPPDIDSKWYKFFEEQKHPKHFSAIFKQPSGLSPKAENISNLPGGRRYYENLATGKTDEWVKVYIHGEYGFVVDGKPIYPEYSDKTHCHAEEPISGAPVVRSFDWGLTPSCIYSQILPTGQWLVFDEQVSDNMSIDEFGDEVVEHCARSFTKEVEFEDYGDPAGEQRSANDKKTAFEIMASKGIHVEGTEQDPTMRIEAVRKTLRTLVGGEPQFILHPRCKVLRKGFLGGYQRRRLAVPGMERYVEKADKNAYSHPHDALQYAAVKLFGQQLVKSHSDDDYPVAQQTGGPGGMTGYG